MVYLVWCVLVGFLEVVEVGGSVFVVVVGVGEVVL